jgi:eukaryotic-like serine/threonine-protein kinase
MSNPSVTFGPGQRIGNYELLLEIASGGTATVGIAVYRGAAGFERLVVIKRVHRHLTRDPEFTAMLLDEARVASSIRHPNVVAVIDVVRVEDEVILVMDYVDSVSLSQLGKEAEQAGRRLPPAVVSRILVDTLTGLHEAHEALDMRRQPLGIVHRDVSPQNIVVGVDGISRVIDFGIAKARSRVAHTRAGVIKGKCAYMAPEQVDGLPVDRRCDVFAAGIVLWEALTGKRLFRGDDEFDEMRRVMRAPIPKPSSVVPDFGSDVDDLLAQALARPADERFMTAQAFARALEHAIPPAPPRAVADQVEAFCRMELDYLLSRLAAILGDELEKLTPGRTPRVTTEMLARHASRDLDRVSGARLSGQGTVRLEAPSPAALLLASSTLRSDEGPPPSVHDDGVELGVIPRRSPAPLFLLVTLASLLAGAGGAFAWLSRAPTPAAPPSSPPSVTQVTPPPASTIAPLAASASAAPSTGVARSPGSASPVVPRSSATPRPSTTPGHELKSNPYGP